MTEEYGKQSVPPFLRRAREALGAHGSERSEPGSADVPEVDSPEAGGADGLSPERTQMNRSVAAAGERIQGILDAAERVADDIRREAETEAEDYVRERREAADALAHRQAEKLDLLLDTLRRELRAVERQGDSMVTAVEAAIAEARRPVPMPPTDVAPAPVPSSETESEPAPLKPSAEPATAPPAAPEAEGEPTDERQEPAPRVAQARTFAFPGRGAGREGVDGPDSAASEGPLIRATQMAVSGWDRSEIEEALKSEFGVGDPTPILDEILGPA